MKKKEFIINSKNTLDWMINYFDELNKYPVKSKVKPRDVFNKIPKNPPHKSENYSEIDGDLLLHWKIEWIKSFPRN